ncbi:hypothetical protein FSARC_13635, partial [Fusarium sarcochroum]
SGSGSGSGGNQGGTSGFGNGRPGKDDDGQGGSASACNSDCADNEICVNGDCLSVSDPASCSPSTGRRFFRRQSTIECPEGYACIDDQCVPIDGPANCGGSNCPLNYACIQDACVQLGDPTDCGGETCASDEICLGNICTPSPELASCLNIVCPKGQTCKDGACVRSGTGMAGNPQGNGGRPGPEGGDDDDNGSGDGSSGNGPSNGGSSDGGSNGGSDGGNGDGGDGTDDGGDGGSNGGSDGGSGGGSDGGSPPGNGDGGDGDDGGDNGAGNSRPTNAATNPGGANPTDQTPASTVASNGAPIDNPGLGSTGATEEFPASSTGLDGNPEGNGGSAVSDSSLATTETDDGSGSRPTQGSDGATSTGAIMTDDEPIPNPGAESTGSLDGPSSTITSLQGGPEGNGGSSVPGDDSSTNTSDGGSVSTQDSDGAESTGSFVTDDGPILNPGTESNEATSASTITTVGAPITNPDPEATDGTSTRLTGAPEGNGGSSVPGEDEGSNTLTETSGGSDASATAAQPTETGLVPCTEDSDCEGISVGLCALSNTICVCVDAVCQPDPDDNDDTTSNDGATQTTGMDNPDGTSTGLDASATDDPVTNCSEDSDCTVNADLCVVGGINICVCIDAICVQNPDNNPTTTRDEDSTITESTNPANPTPTDDGATPCTDDDDCLADVALCLFNGLNRCLCVDAVCVQQPVTGGPEGSGGSAGPTADNTATGDNGQPTDSAGPTTTDGEPAATETAVACSTDDDCLADIGLCVDGLLNLCVCVDAICVVDPVIGQPTTVTDATIADPTATDGEPTSTQTAVACSTDDDCLADIGLCVDGLLNLCVCVDAVCIVDPVFNQPTTATDPIPTETAVSCATDDDCTANVGLCLVELFNICICVDAVCVPGAGGDDPTTTDEGPVAPTAVSCSTSDDCAADADLCLDGLLNLCVCVNAVCVPTTGGDDPTTTDGGPVSPTSVSCSTADDCAADATLCLDGLLNICVCLNAVCVPTTGGGGDGICIDDGDCTGAGEICLEGTCSTPPGTGTSCSTADDCVADADLCLDGLLNLCVCVNAICVQAGGTGDQCSVDADCTTSGDECNNGVCGPPNGGATSCSTADDCTANAALCLDGLLNLCICVNAVCVQAGDGDGGTGDLCLGDADCTTSGDECNNGVCGPPSNGGGTSCSTADDCTANAALCLDGLLNLCVCVNAVCVQAGNGGGGNTGDDCSVNADCTSPGDECNNGVCGPPSNGGGTSCTTADDCTANAGLCLDGLLNLCVCINAVCVQAGNGGGGDTGDSCQVDADCTTEGDECNNGICGAPGGGNAGSCVDANDCLLSVNPLCALGLCVCVDAVCTQRPDVPTCTTNSDCSTGATCQNGACIDNAPCNGAADCVANLDFCALPGACVCLNGVCGLASNGPRPECASSADCRALNKCRLGVCLCTLGQCTV